MNGKKLEFKKRYLSTKVNKIVDALNGCSVDTCVTVLSCVLCYLAESIEVPVPMLLMEVVRRCEIMDK